MKHFNLHVLTKCKLTLFSRISNDLTTRISARVRIKHVFSMNFTHLHEILQQQCFFHCNRPNGTKYANTEKATMEIAFIATQCL